MSGASSTTRTLGTPAMLPAPQSARRSVGGSTAGRFRLPLVFRLVFAWVRRPVSGDGLVMHPRCASAGTSHRPSAARRGRSRSREPWTYRRAIRRGPVGCELCWPCRIVGVALGSADPSQSGSHPGRQSASPRSWRVPTARPLPAVGCGPRRVPAAGPSRRTGTGRPR